MNYFLAFALIMVVIFLTTNMESFTDTFGLSGYTKPVPPVKLDDPRPNLEGFEKFEISVDNDMMEQFVICLLYTSPSPRDQRGSRMPSSA